MLEKNRGEKHGGSLFKRDLTTAEERSTEIRLGQLFSSLINKMITFLIKGYIFLVYKTPKNGKYFQYFLEPKVTSSNVLFRPTNKENQFTMI